LIYLDTSIIVPFYWPEALSDAVDQLLRAETEPGLSQLAEVELFSALSRRVRMGEISQEQARQIAARFQTDLDSGFYTRLLLEPDHYQKAREWLSRFETFLRTLDALHLACANSNDLCLVTADEALTRSAQAIGVEVRLLALSN
jgi:predicted nucleic acid-binding protein